LVRKENVMSKGSVEKVDGGWIFYLDDAGLERSEVFPTEDAAKEAAEDFLREIKQKSRPSFREAAPSKGAEDLRPSIATQAARINRGDGGLGG
jgi:hypothetical protein